MNIVSPYLAPGLNRFTKQEAIKQIKLNRINLGKVKLSESISQAVRILHIVSDYFDVTPDQVKSKSREGTIAKARHICASLIRQKTKMGVIETGKFLNRDHSTIVSSCQVVRDLCRFDKNFKAFYDEIYRYV